jgi:hypothetical protein
MGGIGWMSIVLPPHPEPKLLEFALSLVRRDRREDAAQESWVAHLSGKCPVKAIDHFSRKDSRRLAIDRARAGEQADIKQSRQSSRRIRSMIRPTDAR